MKKTFSMLAVIIVGMLWTAGIISAAQQIYTMTTLTNNDTADDLPEVNTQGWAVWQEIIGSSYEIMLRSPGGTITNISNNKLNNSSPHINQRGDVVWVANDGNDSEIFLYTSNGKRIQITNNTSDDITPVINDQGTIAWAGLANGKWEIFKLDAGVYPLPAPVQITNFSQSNISDNEMPQINNSGIIVWRGTDNNNRDSVGQPAPPDKEIFIYHPQIGVQQLTSNNFDDTEPQINSKGDVVWVGLTSKGTEIFYYHAMSGKITTLTDNSFDDHDPRINDSGDVTWVGESGTITNTNDPKVSTCEIYHYNARTGITTRLTNNQVKDGNPHIDSIGDVVWEGSDGNDMEIFMYHAFTNSISQVTNNAVNDVLPFNANGKIVFLTSSPDKEVMLAVPSLTADSDNDGVTISGGDCDDLDPTIKPGAPELDDTIDNNCNGKIDEGFTQVCGNGKREGSEICDDGNKIDNDGCNSDCTAPAADYYLIKQITNYPYRQIQAHTNSKGDIVWRGNDGMDDEIYFHNNTSNTTTRLTNNTGNDRTPAINENGDIAWVCDEDGTDDDICIIPKDGTKIILQALPPALSGKDDNVVLAENGDLAWVATVGGHDQIYFYDYSAATVKALTTSALNKSNPRIASSDTNTFVTWQAPTGRDTGMLDNEIFLYNHATGVTTQVNPNNSVEDSSPVVNSLGDVAWVRMTGAYVSSYEMMLYDASANTILQITDDADNPAEDFYPEIATVNGNTYIAWARSVPIAGTNGMTDYHVMLYKHLATPEYLSLTTNGIILEHISINSNGDVTWDAHDGHDREIMIYDNTKGTVTQVTANTLMDSYPNVGINKRLTWMASSAPGSPEQIYQSIPVTCTDADKDGWSTCQGDCDDSDPTVYPGAPELCDNKNNNCDALGLIDEIKVTYYRDQDGDGYGDSQVSQTACSQPAGYVTTPGDCDDTKANIKPGGMEICESYGATQVDNNCDGVIYDPALYSTYWVDSDNDGYGDGNAANAIQVCAAAPSGYALAANGTDPDDDSPDCYPESPEGSCTVAENYLYFPYIYDGFNGWADWLSVVNATTATMDLDVKLYDNNGNVVASRINSYEPPARDNSRAAYTMNNNANFDGSMIIKSNVKAIGQMTHNNATAQSISIYEAVTPIMPTLNFPKMSDSDGVQWNGYTNQIVLLNTSKTQPADITLEIFNRDTNSWDTPKSFTIPPLGRFIKRPSDPTLHGSMVRGAVRVNTNQPLAGIITYERGNSAHTIYETPTPRNELYFPQVVSDDAAQTTATWITWLTAMKSDVNDTQISVKIFNDSGRLLGTDANLPTAPTLLDGVTVSEWNQQPFSLRTDSLKIFNGPAKVLADYPVSGLINFREKNNNAFTIYEPPFIGTNIFFPKIKEDATGWQNYISVMSTNDTTDTSIQVECVIDADQSKYTDTAVIPPNGRYHKRPSQISGKMFVGNCKAVTNKPAAGVLTYEFKSGTTTTAHSIYRGILTQ